MANLNSQEQRVEQAHMTCPGCETEMFARRIEMPDSQGFTTLGDNPRDFVEVICEEGCWDFHEPRFSQVFRRGAKLQGQAKLQKLWDERR